MSVVFVREQHASGGLATSSPDLLTLTRNFTRTFHVKMSTWEDGPKTVERAVDPSTGLAIPQLYQPYFRSIAGGGGEAEGTSYASDIQVNRKSEKERIWAVSVSYERRESDPSDPLKKIPDIRIGFENFQEPVEADIFGQAILNSVFDRFNPAATKDASRLVLTITRNEAVFDIIQARKFQDAINSKKALGFLEPLQGKMNIGATRQNYTDQAGKLLTYWSVTYTIKVREEGWRKRILDKGFHVRADGLDGAPGSGTPFLPLDQVQRRITDKNGVPVRIPALLDGNGGQLKAGRKPIFLTFQVYNELDFNDIKPKLPEYQKGF